MTATLYPKSAIQARSIPNRLPPLKTGWTNGYGNTSATYYSHTV